MGHPQSPAQVLPIGAADRDAACRLVFRRLPATLHPQQMAALTGDEVLLGGYRGSRLVGAVLAQPQAVDAATLWPPQVLDDESSETAGELLAAAMRQLAQRQVRLVQTLLETDAQPEAAVLLAGGFSHATDLLYLDCHEGVFPTTRPETSLAFESVETAGPERLVRVVEATYVETLDCPVLNGVRSVADVLAGYRASGVFDSHAWLIASHAGRDVGCLILTAYPEHGFWELTYMGVVPGGRGHGWGADLARHAQWLARQAGQPRLVLAVDARNDPAIRAYAGVGFHAWDRRSVYLKMSL